MMKHRLFCIALAVGTLVAPGRLGSAQEEFPYQIFERYLERPDSALFYYARLLNTYPESEQARAVRPLVEATLAGNSAIDTSSADGLVPLAEAEGIDTEDGGDAEEGVDAADAWHDPRLYDPIPELALKRRGFRTEDLDVELE